MVLCPWITKWYYVPGLRWITQLTKDQITTLTAGIVQTEIVEEKWDGRSYWLKSKITADSEQVVRAIDTLRKDREKTKELNEIRRRSDALLKENEKLRKELTKATGKDKQKKVAAYAKTVRELTADEWYEKGYSFFMSGNYQSALDAFNKSIELNPKRDAGAYLNRGSIYRHLGNNKHAIRDYDKAIEIDPKYVDAYVLRGGTYFKLGNSNQAIKDHDKAIEIDPKNARAYLLRGLGYGSLGNNNQAVTDMKIAARLGEEAAQSYLRGKGISW